MRPVRPAQPGPARQGLLKAVLLVVLEAAPSSPPDSMSVTVSAGPIAVVEAPPDLPAGTSSDSTTPSDQALVLSAPPSGPGLEELLGAARGREGRDLAGLISKAAHRFIRSLGNELRDYAEGVGPPAGRRKKNDGWPMLGAGLIMGGTLLTIGLGALAAMSGKALMSSMLALGMSLMSAFRPAARRCRRSTNNDGCGGDGGDDSSRYEIIARPVITHGHTHSAVLHHDPGTPTGYPGYVRSLIQTGTAEQVLAAEAAAMPMPGSSTVEVTDFARSGASRLGGSRGSDSDEAGREPGAWPSGVIGMRSPQAVQPQSDSALSMGSSLGSLGSNLGTWGKQHATNTQPRALEQASPTPASA